MENNDTNRAPVKPKSDRYLTSIDDVNLHTKRSRVLMKFNCKRIFPGVSD